MHLHLASRRCLLLPLLFAPLAAHLWAEPKDPALAPITSRHFLSVGYLPEYRLATFDPSRADYLTDLIYFSLEPNPAGELDLSRFQPGKVPGPDRVAGSSRSDGPDSLFNTETLRRLREIKKRKPIRLLVALGGWDRSKNFAAIAANDAARARLVQSLNGFCLDNHFDGADFDWEHPTNEVQEEGYARLLVETKQAFKKHGLLVTVALASWQRLPAKAFRAVDRVHLMAYDHEGRHSTLDQARSDVAALVKQGIPRDKICLGLPLYGRKVNKNNEAVTYADLVRQYRPAPALDEVDGIYFNGIDTIRKKTRWAIDNGLGGVMIWELGQDSTDASLLRTIHRSIPK